MRFVFENKKEAFDIDRAGFANRVCKLIYQQNNKDVDKAIEFGEKIFSDFDDHVRNIYELIGQYIPLIAYYELKTFGADNFDFNEEEYEKALQSAKSACELYYS